MATVKPTAKKVLLPVRIPPAQFADLIADAKHFRLTKDGVVQAALQNLFCFKREERARLYKSIPKKIFGRPLAMLLILCATSSAAQAYTAYQLADSIFIAEGGAKTAHPYGIMQTYRNTTPRQACINTIKHRLGTNTLDDKFVLRLADTYCPPSVDPIGNRNWKHNVIKILHSK